jgi:FkbM family methyltransferase
MSRYDRQLNDLLSLTPARIRACMQRWTDGIGWDGASFALYGAGSLGAFVLPRLRAAGIEPVAFADDTPEKQGRYLEGVPILGPREALARHGSDLVFVVTMLNPNLKFSAAKRRLAELGAEHVVSFLHVAHRFPDLFLPYIQFDLPERLLAQAPEIQYLARVLADDESRRQLIAHLEFRLKLDFDALPARIEGGYFAADFLAALPANTIYVDCGAYDGDTIRLFLARQQNRFARILAFEPDPHNYRRLSGYIQGLPPDIRTKIIVHQAGVGSRRHRSSFNACGNMAAALSPEGQIEVDILPLHECLDADESLTVIKYDVEGAEREALEGTAPLIRRRAPILMVSVYHQPDDLWKIPLLLNGFDVGYRLYLRTLGEDGMDVICYGVPPEYDLERPAPA